MWDPSYLASFTYHNVFEAHQCCNSHHYFIPFYCKIVYPEACVIFEA